jgi:hypothetical protein
MLLEDLQHIFKPQIDQSWAKLRFLLIENNLQLVHLHAVDDLAGLVPQLDQFQYREADPLAPRFYK